MQEEFCSLYRSTLPAVYGFLIVRAGGDRALAEDLTAETYAAAVEKFGRGEAHKVTISWLKTVARRRLIDHWRRNQLAIEHGNMRPDPVTVKFEASIADQDLVIEALQKLTTDEQRALVLQHIEGYSVKDVASILGRSEKATESLLGRARMAFRTAFKEVDHD